MPRPVPKLGPAAYKTYTISAPIQTHWRQATCEEIACPHFLNGWRVRLEQLTPDLIHAARTSGRRFRELAIAEGETYLVFVAGQPCFKASEHRKRLDRAELYVVQGGDWRGNPRGENPLVHSGSDAWVDDFATHQSKLADAANKG